MNGLSERFRNVGVRTKILLGFAPVILLMLLIGGIVVALTGGIMADIAESRRATKVAVEASDLAQAFTDRASALRDYALTGEAAPLNDYRAADQRLTAVLKEAHSLVHDPDQRERLQEFEEASRAWEEDVAERVMSLRGQSVESTIAFYRGDAIRGRVRAVRVTIDAFTREQLEITEDRRQAVNGAIVRIRWTMGLLTLAAILAAVGIASWLSIRISRPLNRAVVFAGAVAAGELTQRLEVEGRDEIGQLAGTLNRMAGDLRQSIGGVNTATVQVAAAAEQIAVSSRRMSQTVDDQVAASEQTSASMEEIASQLSRVAASTESLAASVDQTSSSIAEMGRSIENTAGSAETLGTAVEQTSATIEEMAASIQQVGRHVEETRSIAQEAEAHAQAGGTAVARTVEGMRRIRTEVDQLGDAIRQLGERGESVGLISETIKDIADQTNLLALNAAIEAARAGEHGRGFAVVAQEIRRLAERSVESTREITVTIRGITSEVSRATRSSAEVAERTREGIELVEGAAQTLDAIVESASRTSTLMAQVALATDQQILAAGQAREATQHIRDIAEEVRLATREQHLASGQIVQATENMNQQTQEVFAATAEQKRGGEMILRASENIAQGARAAQASVREATNAADDVAVQATRLTELMRRFDV